MLELIAGKGPTIVVVQDQSGRKFGGYADSSWSTSRKASFFGGSSCFLFSILDQSQSSMHSDACIIHRPTNPNSVADGNFLYCNYDGKLVSRSPDQVRSKYLARRQRAPNCIGFGGQLYEEWGDCFGLCVYDGLQDGMSCACATYGNPVLNSDSSDNSTLDNRDATGVTDGPSGATGPLAENAGKFKIHGLEVWVVSGPEVAVPQVSVEVEKLGIDASTSFIMRQAGILQS